ncbi:MAG: hypothetical protein P4L50_17915 [Anaerolineaceae bacterium]|nr:hypothetical protein [Anaerolineaceae bacterium]
MDLKFLNGFIDWFFHYSTSKKHRWLNWAFFGVLLLLGLYLWGVFLNWGKISFTYEDWAAITGPRLSFLRDAMTKLVLPLHISDTVALDAPTDRFLSIPNVFIGPTVILLYFLSIQKFIVVQTAIMFLAGYAGLLVLRKQLKLSLFAFTVLFFLFNFNGHILSHYSVGHFSWNSYFLLALFAALVIELLQKKSVGWAWVTKTTLVMLLMFLQGAFHFFLYSLTFLLVLAIFSPKYFLTVAETIAASGLASAVRILPALLETGSLKVTFLGGYPMVHSLWDALVTPTFPGVYITDNGVNAPLGNWEYTIYIGLAGALFLIFFGIYRTLRNNRRLSAAEDVPTISVVQNSPYRLLLLPCLVFTLFSFNAVFKELRNLLSIPPLTGERVASRLFIFAVLFIMILAVYELQKWLDNIQVTSLIALGSLLVLGFELNDLWQNFQFWMVSYAVTTFEDPSTFEQGHWVVSNHSDGHYFLFLAAGLALTCLTLLVLAFLVRHDKRRALAVSKATVSSGVSAAPQS